jgi:hypothetical protein
MKNFTCIRLLNTRISLLGKKRPHLPRWFTDVGPWHEHGRLITGRGGRRSRRRWSLVSRDLHAIAQQLRAVALRLAPALTEGLIGQISRPTLIDELLQYEACDENGNPYPINNYFEPSPSVEIDDLLEVKTDMHQVDQQLVPLGYRERRRRAKLRRRRARREQRDAAWQEGVRKAFLSRHEGGQPMSQQTPECPTCICGKRAPVQGDRGVRQGKGPGSIAWHEHEEAWAGYAREFGTGQSASRVAERGGFSYYELTLYLGREPSTWVSAAAGERR